MSNDGPNPLSPQRPAGRTWRKKPVEIEAVRNTGEWGPIREWLAEVAGDEDGWPAITRNGDGTLNIDTLEGLMRANVGDWLIRGVAGEFYPCKPDIFKATYERVEVVEAEGEGDRKFDEALAAAMPAMVNRFMWAVTTGPSHPDATPEKAIEAIIEPLRAALAAAPPGGEGEE